MAQHTSNSTVILEEVNESGSSISVISNHTTFIHQSTRTSKEFKKFNSEMKTNEEDDTESKKTEMTNMSRSQSKEILDVEPLPNSENVAKLSKTTMPKLAKMVTMMPGANKNKSFKMPHAFYDAFILYKVIKPVLIVLQSCGMLPMKIRTGRSTVAPELDSRREFISVPLLIYSGVIVVVMTANCIRSFLAFNSSDNFGSNLFFKIKITLFWYEAASRAILANMVCIRDKKNVHNVFKTFAKICFTDGIISYEDALKRSMVYSLLVVVFMIILNAATLFYGLFIAPKEVQKLFGFIVAPLDPESIGAKIAIWLLLTWAGVVALSSLCLFTTICYIFYKEFEVVTKAFASKIKEDGVFLDDLEKYRLMHQKRCKILDEADQIFKYYIANTYGTNIPLLCLLLYGLVFSEHEAAGRLTDACFLLGVLFHVTVITISAVIVNGMAHAPLNDIYSIRVKNTTSERQLIVSMFLNKLTATSIGMTAWDMFVINKPTILTVIGMFTTYFFLLVQFKNPGAQAPKCLCTVDGNHMYNGSIIN